MGGSWYAFLLFVASGNEDIEICMCVNFVGAGNDIELLVYFLVRVSL